MLRPAKKTTKDLPAIAPGKKEREGIAPHVNKANNIMSSVHAAMCHFVFFDIAVYQPRAS